MAQLVRSQYLLRSSIIFILLVVALVNAAPVQAQDLWISPTSWDFGNVLVGSSSTTTFDLLSGGPGYPAGTAVWVYVVLLNETADDNPPYVNPHDWLDPQWSLGAFSFNPITWELLPQELLYGDHIMVDVTFTPTSPGGYSAYLGILSNDA
ncbi:MAG: hypothetical protein JW787_14385 [Sedimentisphaerales bacterium]|nr:hypothetical protein [Sedimentisphaerales bacterium]